MHPHTKLLRRDRRARIAAGMLVLSGALIAFLRNRSVGLVGTDTYPLILASRVRSLDELVAAVTEPMGGGHLAPIYYRPVLHLSLSLDYALGGLDASVYQLTSVLIFAAASASLFFAAEQLTSGRARVSALVALTFFVVHPVQAVTIPDLARRPELFGVLFMSLAVAAQARAAREERRLPVVPAAFTLFALLSKETTFVVPALCFVAAWVAAPPLPWRRRLVSAGVAVIPSLTVLLGVLALRLAVLGDALGARPFRSDGLVGAYAATFGSVVGPLTSGGGFVGDPSPPLLLLSGLAVALAVSIGTARADLRGQIFRETAPVVGVAVSWLALCTLVYTFSGIQPWYLAIPAAGVALLAGGLGGALLRVLGEARASLRAVAAVGLLCGAVLLIDLVRFSPLVRAYPEWQRATRMADRYLERLGDSLERAKRGTVVQVPAPPVFATARRDATRLRGVYVLAPGGLAPWAALQLEGRRLRFVEEPAGAAPRPLGEILVVIGRSPLGRSRP